jgi:hypothetical protein
MMGADHSAEILALVILAGFGLWLIKESIATLLYRDRVRRSERDWAQEQQRLAQERQRRAQEQAKRERYEAQERQRLAQERHNAYLQSPMYEVDHMDGVDFEHYVAARLRSAGYTVEMTTTTGDFGVDLIVTSPEGVRRAIQCKRKAKPVGVSAVQEVVAGAKHYGCTSTMVVSNSEFTPAAIQLANANSCLLIGRSRLIEGQVI